MPGKRWVLILPWGWLDTWRSSLLSMVKDLWCFVAVFPPKALRIVFRKMTWSTRRLQMKVKNLKLKYELKYISKSTRTLGTIESCFRHWKPVEWEERRPSLCILRHYMRQTITEKITSILEKGNGGMTTLTLRVLLSKISKVISLYISEDLSSWNHHWMSRRAFK